MDAAENLAEPHEPHWLDGGAFLLITLTLLASQALVAVAVHGAHYWLAAPLILVIAHCMHGQLIGFHEASHGMLRKSRLLNEIDGVLIGALSFMSLTAYRVLHQTHHMHLGSARDEEFWPFVDPRMPRWARRLAAAIELTFGIVATPALFLRTFLREGSPIRSRRVRRRIWAEYALSAFLWAAIVTGVTLFGVWHYFLWVLVAPAFLAGNLQSWRKYIEHVGMTGSTVNGCTRSIVARGWPGRLMALSLLHEPYHGVHHQHAGVPHARLPALAGSLEPRHPGERPPFPSYRHALLDLIRSLANPRVGPQWRES